MAGDWIKMQGNLWTSPKVVRIMSATKADKCRVIGALFRVWCLFDEHTEDGKLEGYTKFLLDDELRLDGFSDALESIGWLIDLDGEGLQVPDFNEHMSKSAKRRAQETKRKRDSRKVSASEADKKRSREEKRREEKDICNTAPKVADFDCEKHFDIFWNKYPSRDGSKGSKKKSLAKFQREIKSPKDFALIMAGLDKHISIWNDPKYIPMVTTWLNGECWNDDVSSPSADKPNIDNLGDNELFQMAEGMGIHTQGKYRGQLISAIKGKMQ